MDSEEIVVAVIGCGYWGPNHVRNLVGMSGAGVRMKTAVDRDPVRRERIGRLYPGVALEADDSGVLEDPEVDAVVISTPVGTHVDLAKAALRAGKHVLVEKPLATNVAGACELVALADDLGLALMVGHTFEYTAAVAYMRSLVASGELGDIAYVRSLRVNLGLYQRDVNVMWDLAPHDISILNYVLGGEPVAVSAIGRGTGTPRHEDIVNLSVEYPGGVLATIIVSWLDPRKVREMTVVGSRKMLVYDDVSATEKIRIFDKGVDGPKEYDSFGDFPFSYRYGDIVIPRLEDGEPLQAELTHFVECVRSGERPRSDGRSGLGVVRVLAAAELSLREDGRRVLLDEGSVSGIDGLRSKRGAA